MATTQTARYNVGGVWLERPFKIRRLGHFGFNVVKLEESLRFYTELLGFRISDVNDWTQRVTPEQLEGLGDPHGYFTRYGGDHHAFVLFNKRLMDALNPGRAKPGVTINQITWQVGSLAEVGAAPQWFREQGVELIRTGRDMPGSNWHTYAFDPDGHTNELYYGIEQVGWDGYSKPRSMYYRGFREEPPLPQQSEFDEVQEALAKDIDTQSGYRYLETRTAKYDVDGVLLPRPFKIVRIGPVRLFVRDMAKAEVFYTQSLGFTLTEDVVWEGHRCVFLRTSNEHHAVALYPIELRERLGLSPHSSCMSFGVQLANYRQLKDAVAFLLNEGVRVTTTQVPPQLYPGMDYVAHAFDADGHCIELYYYMEQVGWDGNPRPQSQRRPIDTGHWPDALEPLPDTYHGEPFLGPWG